MWKLLKDFYHEQTAYFLTAVCTGLAIGVLGLYFFAEPPLYKNHLLPHLTAVFFEVGLAIFFIEAILKPKEEVKKNQQVKRAKKQSFLRTLHKNDIDILLFDCLQHFEEISKFFPSDEPHSHKNRLDFIQQYDTYFVYFEKAEYTQSKIKSRAPRYEITKKLQHILKSWEQLIDEALTNVRLTASKPQYTPYHSWDYLVEFFVELKKQNHEVNYRKSVLNQTEILLKLYFSALKALCSFHMDFEHFNVESHIPEFTERNKIFSKKVYRIWYKTCEETQSRFPGTCAPKGSSSEDS